MLQITGMLYNLILWLYNWLCSWLYICCFNINVSYVHSSLGSLVVYLMLYTIFVLSYFCCMLEAVRRVSMGDNNKLLTTWQAASGTEFLNSSESTTVAQATCPAGHRDSDWHFQCASAGKSTWVGSWGCPVSLEQGSPVHASAAAQCRLSQSPWPAQALLIQWFPSLHPGRSHCDCATSLWDSKPVLCCKE